MRPWYFAGIAIALAIFVVAVVGTGARQIVWFLSVPSFIVVVIPPLALSLGSFSFRELGRCFTSAFRTREATRADVTVAIAYFEALSRYVFASGILGFFIGAIVLLANLGGDSSVVGAGTAVSLLTVVYAALIEILIPVPFRLALRQRLARMS